MEEIGSVDAKLGTKRRTHPPKHSYAAMRQSRKARRHRTAGSGASTFCSVESLNWQTASVQLAAAAQCDILKLLNFLPAHLIIPPGTNVSVPPPPLPLLPPNFTLMRFPLRHLFMKSPPPPHFATCPRLFNPYLNAADKSTHDSTHDSSAGSENPLRAKIQFPPPPLPLFPMALRPPATPPFLDNSYVPPPAPQDFRIFAEHTIKAALGINPGSSIQLRNY